MTSYIKALNQQFTNVTSDSRQVKSGSLFLAYPGEHRDGRDFITQAIANGASAVMWESKLDSSTSFTWQSNWPVNHLAVPNLKQKVGEIAAEFYQYPTQKCTVIGVTGTNGKTSVSQWIAQCLTSLGQKTAVIGTIGNGFIDSQTATLNTTPDAILLQALLAAYVAEGAEAVAMEVSSHGLAQGRVNGVAFDIAILTNLSRDHLDYHQTMEAYADAKRALFDWDGLKSAILNADDTFGASVANALQAANKPYLTYGMQTSHVDVYGYHLQLHESGLSMQVKTPQGEALVEAAVLGEFNAYNVLAVLACLLSLNIELQASVAAIKSIKPVAGRMQRLGGGALPLVVIDYAHTPDALEKVLQTLRQQLQASHTHLKNKTNHLICVFGCGGGRDAGKRSLMGQVVAVLADEMVVTSDNPRNEVPADIAEQIVVGLDRKYNVELDRAKAIDLAINMAKAGDIVLIAGKGHEDYQEITGVKYPFSDALIATQGLQAYDVMHGQNKSEVAS
jgi:UDP-N-acetylmuramyl-tripeptide synthetase